MQLDTLVIESHVEIHTFSHVKTPTTVDWLTND